MTISDEQFEQLVGIVNGLVTVVEKGFAEIKLALPPPTKYRVPSLKQPSVPPLTAVEIDEKLGLLERDLESTLLLSDESLRSRQGVEIHARIERLKVELVSTYPEYEQQRDRLLDVTRRLIKGVFTINATVDWDSV